jgi:hypothetical protein
MLIKGRYKTIGYCSLLCSDFATGRSEFEEKNKIFDGKTALFS